jgi:CRISPR-associated protein (TIGR02584 family)
MSGTHPDPSHFPRRILLAVTGLSPQVVTETLFALATRERDPWIPTEIHLITTTEGAERARLSLLHPKSGWFLRLCRDYGLPSIRFGADLIHELRAADGMPLTDIRTLEDNTAAADAITEQVRSLTADPHAALHVSIAGGRKTMGFYLGYALSLYGRPQDRLSHVLVSAPYESHPQFFYPTPESDVIHTPPPDSRPYDTRDARVTLAEIPFVRVRDGLPQRLIEGAASFSATVEAAQRALAPARLNVDLNRGCIHAGGETIALQPASLAFYAMLARRRVEGLDGVRWTDDGIAEAYLAAYREIDGDLSSGLERAAKALSEGMTKDYFDQRKSRVNSAIEKALGPQLAAAYLIHPDGARPQTRFGLTLDAGAIGFSSPNRPDPASLRSLSGRTSAGDDPR